MNLKKTKLILITVLVVAFLAMGSVQVFADEKTPSLYKTTDTTGNTNGENKNASITPTNGNTNTSNSKVPNTGLSDLPWVAIGLFAVSAVFAYKKVKEYNID